MAKQEWFTTEAAVPLLGFDNQAQLRYWLNKGRVEGWLKLDVHYRVKFPNAARKTYEINVDACNDRKTNPLRGQRAS